MHSPRRAAVSVLRAWAKGVDYAESLVERQAVRRQLSAPDRALLNALVLGVLRHRRLLDHWLAGLRRGRLDHETRDILRVGLCQLLILGLPDHAAVFETVQLGRAPVRGLLNAVLRRAANRRQRLLDEARELPPAVRHSHPDWLVRRWQAQFGAQDCLVLLEWNNRPAETFARVHALGGGADADPALPPPDPALPPGFVRIDGPVPAAWLDRGALYVQDPSTRHAVELLAPRPGERTLDACAAPGGKAALIADRCGSAAGLVCTDANVKRLPRLRENLSRLHCADATVLAHDWTTPAPPDWRHAFDAILADVPCSNTGVLRRRVDARWRLQPPQLADLVALQRAIVAHLVPCLKPGGRLVYSTCSLEPEENEDQVAALLAAHPELQLAATRTALPHRDATDGAFAALFDSRKRDLTEARRHGDERE